MMRFLSVIFLKKFYILKYNDSIKILPIKRFLKYLQKPLENLRQNAYNIVKLINKKGINK